MNQPAQDDRAARMVVLTSIWKLMEKSHHLDEPVLKMLVNGTMEFTIEQIQRAGGYIAKHPPKPGTPLLGALCERMDWESRGRQWTANKSTEFWCVPALAIDLGRQPTQFAILNAWKKPASQARWAPEELGALRAELEDDSPALATSNAAVRARMAYFAQYGRFP